MNQVQVIWDDARSIDGWIEQKDIELHLARITTLGFVAKESETILCVAASLDDATQQVSGLMFIPKSCIVSIEELG